MCSAKKKFISQVPLQPEVANMTRNKNLLDMTSRKLLNFDKRDIADMCLLTLTLHFPAWNSETMLVWQQPPCNLGAERHTLKMAEKSD